MRQPIRFALVAAGLVILLIFLTRGRSPLTERTGRNSADDSAPPRPAAVTVLEAPDDAADAIERSVVSANSPRAEPEADASFSAEHVEIVVVDRLTQAPVPGAEIRHLTAHSDREAGQFNSDSMSDEIVRKLERSGALTIADEHGRALFPKLRRHTLLLGRSGERFGLLTLRTDAPSSVLLELTLDASVTVQVLDAHGVPRAGVPIGLYPEDDRFLGSMSSATTEGPDALATLPHVGLMMDANPWRDLAVSISGLFAPSVQVLLARGYMPREPVVLRLPPHGELEIVLRRADGTLDERVTALHIAIVRPESPGAEAVMIGAPLIEVVGGRQRFPFVMLGAEFRASTRRSVLGSAAVQGPGPLVSGARASLTLVTDVPLEKPAISVRLVDVSGQPLAHTMVFAKVCGATPPLCPTATAAHADADGRFVMQVTDERVGKEPLQLRVEPMEASPARGVLAAGKIWLPQDLPNGITDVGDLVLASPPVIASGTVLDDADLPVAGATVSVAPGPSATATSSYTQIRARSDRAGRFELQGAIDWRALLLTASQQGYSPAEQECALGRTDIVLRISKAGEIAGRLWLPSGVHRSEIRIDCTREDAKSDSTRSMGLRIDEAGGAFRIVNLEPGVYSVDVALVQEATTLLEARGLRVVGGETLRDPRLDPLDLRSVIYTHELNVRSDDGRNVREIGLGWRKAGDASRETYGYSTSGGTLRAIPIFSIFDAIDLDVDASEMLKVHVPNVRGRADVVMKRSVHVTLTLDETSRLPEAPFSIQPVLVSEAGELWSGDVFDARRVSTLTPAWISRCEVRFQVFKENRGLDDAWIVPNPRQWVTIADQPKAQSFEVSFTPNELKQAMSVY